MDWEEAFWLGSGNDISAATEEVRDVICAPGRGMCCFCYEDSVVTKSGGCGAFCYEYSVVTNSGECGAFVLNTVLLQEVDNVVILF